MELARAPDSARSGLRRDHAPDRAGRRRSLRDQGVVRASTAQARRRPASLRRFQFDVRRIGAELRCAPPVSWRPPPRLARIRCRRTSASFTLAEVDLDVALRARAARRRAARSRPARRSTPTDCRARRRRRACSAAAAQARITSSGACGRLAQRRLDRRRSAPPSPRRSPSASGTRPRPGRRPRCRDRSAPSSSCDSRRAAASPAACQPFDDPPRSSARDFGRPATIASSDAPTAPASAAAEPPPGRRLRRLKRRQKVDDG